MLPETGKLFSLTWRTRIFEYTWLYTSAGRYKDFWHCIEDALNYTQDHLGVKLSTDQQQELLNTFITLQAYPDVKAALDVLQKADIKLGFLSNMTEAMLHSNIKSAGLEGRFDHVISTDRIKSYKPDPNAYRLGMETFGVKREQIVFTAFAGWDAAGAKWFGYPTVWVNRLNFTTEKIGPAPDRAGRNMQVLQNFVLKS